jgi:hypothetical protein
MTCLQTVAHKVPKLNSEEVADFKVCSRLIKEIVRKATSKA